MGITEEELRSSIKEIVNGRMETLKKALKDINDHLRFKEEDIVTTKDNFRFGDDYFLAIFHSYYPSIWTGDAPDPLDPKNCLIADCQVIRLHKEGHAVLTPMDSRFLRPIQAEEIEGVLFELNKG